MNLAPTGITPTDAVTSGLFGGNILATHGSLDQSAYGEAIDTLGVTTLRFPGGSLTEYLFDIENPDNTSVFDPRVDAQSDMMSLTEFMTYAEVNGHAVSIVVPTRTELGTRVDANGDRLPQVDEDALRGFVQDVAQGIYGNAEVRAFEVGNEYWGSGEMTAAEYGRLAAEMSVIIDKALAEIGQFDTDVVVQKGNNYDVSNLGAEYEGVVATDALADVNARYDLDLGAEVVYGGGGVDWTQVNNEIIRANFEEGPARDAIDGVVAHVYTFGADRPNSRSFDLENVNESWRAEQPELDIYITEWNLKSTANLDREEDYGLFQAHEMLNIVEEFVLSDVEEANVWPLIQNTSNPLSVGRSFDAPTASGEFFAMMAETLPGKVLLDLAPDDIRNTEQTENGVSVHAFAGEGELALYVVNTDREDAVMTDVDLSGLVSSFASADITRLGVAAGEAAGDNQSTAVAEDLTLSDVLEGEAIAADLLPGEILQIVLQDLAPTAAFEEAWARANDPDFADLTDSPMIKDQMQREEDFLSEKQNPLEAAEGEEDAGVGGLVFGLVLLPILALFGMG